MISFSPFSHAFMQPGDIKLVSFVKFICKLINDHMHIFYRNALFEKHVPESLATIKIHGMSHFDP